MQHIMAMDDQRLMLYSGVLTNNRVVRTTNLALDYDHTIILTIIVYNMTVTLSETLST